MLTSALLPIVLATAFADPPVLARPYGNVMGDGLDLRIATEPQAGAVCAPGETLFGIDVSYYQDTIDWNAVAADGVQFAIVRVSHSLQFFDPQFDANLAGARAAGIHTGVYQYFEPDEDPVAQADLLLEAMGPLLPGDLPPMIDVESTGGLGPAAINDAIHAWIDRVESQLGVKPVIYSGYYFWNDNVGSTDFGDYPLMLPWYGVDCPGGVPTGWDMWTIHQYCDCGTIAGISGPVDVNNFNGGLADLEALTYEPVCGDAMCSAGETPYACAQDCPPCGTIAAAGGTIDNGDACYALFGDAQYWRDEAVGEGGSSVWTYTTDLDAASNYAVWQLHFLEAGLYDLEVHIAQPFGKSTNATYVVRHAGGESPVVIDQSVNDGWVTLGEYQFDAAADHTVRMGDNTGESTDAQVQLVFDAVRITRLDLDPDTGEEGGPSTTDPSGGESDDDGTDGAGDDAAGTSGGDPADTDDTLGSLPPPGESAGGCGCMTGGRVGGLALLPWLALVLARRRRPAAC
jgi:GH25 family lysozyme M1 (1,4-beta-N-acetylmuramidase)